MVARSPCSLGERKEEAFTGDSRKEVMRKGRKGSLRLVTMKTDCNERRMKR